MRLARILRAGAAVATAAACTLLAACGSTPISRPQPELSAQCATAPASVASAVAAAVTAPVAVPRPTRPPRIGLALGGGAARGFAHIGVIEVLEENGIHPDLVAGTSAGSVVAALYAYGRSGRELAEMANKMDESAITDWSFPLLDRGVIAGNALAEFIRESVHGKEIDQMRLPLGIVATDLDSGRPIVFRHGDTGTAVRASSSVPGVFRPVRIGSREYVDGGLTAPVPVRAVRDMGADVVIAVDISQAPEGGDTSNTVRMLLQTFSIMGRSINELELKEADIVVRPRLVGVSGTDFSSRQKNILAGREATLAVLPLIKAKLAQQVSLGR
ncbi:MAG: patatin-like phospholipase family protein [Burkholderiaceae bacterium]